MNVANSIETSLRMVRVARFLSKYISELWSCLPEHALISQRYAIGGHFEWFVEVWF
jgi:hypothetical protein